ncbi:type II toxin-antitoxin system RelB family antitoxin [Tetragenococcus koreensis]|uniref:DUF1778 domain-containing protein n=1 Tax=Tetragenococcus koreensis TaxID=290335 RepID=A0AAN4RL35_9ENTE|nr:DUF6290 family protein [Tetragenococcus koreensis]MDN6292275.1 DUF6290 family protein [Tetragenococcus halophilus]MDN6730777.1 DUF6290 family protein [Atopostipes suicloacalis]MCF1615453.1 DUF6290 family protein [Tetragenococcus koreensis]MCF1617778.1 DUF6290 family protein [Tetragenococcus koreensis]MCF1622561.1 DUF6290 family protein [Tetragenococcus koreensis]
MSNPTITFRLSKEEKEFLEKIADFNDLSLSDFVRKETLEAAEEQIDRQTYKKLMEEHEENDQSISHQEMLKELGL